MSEKVTNSNSVTQGASPTDPYNPQNASLPLLVRMPDGERHQVDVAPNASVKDLKSSIANLSSAWNFPSDSAQQDQPWELDFGGSVLNDNQTLGYYNIPEAYDHANGLLKTISDSGYIDPDKKVEALDKACAVVVGISRGERDMERLINSVFEDTNDMAPVSPSAQPTLRSMRKARRSRIPPLNFSNLPPPGPLPIKQGSQKIPSAPPTPSQLIRRLSTSRPDLYDPSAAARATSSSALPPLTPTKSGPNTSDQHGKGSDELKRGNTWFNFFGNSILGGKRNYVDDGSSGGEGDKSNDVEGDSEDEAIKKPVAALTSLPDSASIVPQAGATNTGAGTTSERHLSTDKGSSSQPNQSSTDCKATTAQPLGEVAKPGAPKPIATTTVHPPSSSTPSVPSEPVSSKDPSNKLSDGNNATVIPTSKPDTSKQIIGLAPDHSEPIDIEDVKMAMEDVKIPKKRGRKRKNPHLTEDERKAQRQAQNRESAKLSRIRRKNMTMEYERRVNTLEGENENLRDTVAALTDRLEMLQNLLTISVQKRPLPHLNTQSQDAMGSLAQIASPSGLSTQAQLGLSSQLPGHGALGAPGALANHAAINAQNVITSQAQLNAVSHLAARQPIAAQAPGHTVSAPLGHPTAQQSSHLANLEYKNL